MSDMQEPNTINTQSLSPAEDVRAWQEQLLQGVFKAVAIIGPIVALAATYDAYQNGSFWTIPFYWGTYLAVVLLGLSRWVPYSFRAWLITGFLYLLGVIDFFQDGLGGSARLFMLIVPFVAALFLGRKASIFALILCSVTMGGVGLAFSTGRFMAPIGADVGDPGRWIAGTLTVFMLGTLIVVSLDYLVPRFTAALTRSRRLTEELESHQAELEVQVAERTQQLETLVNVSRQLISILDLNDLLGQVVTSIQQAFGYYHVHIYLIDQNTGELVMREGTGSIGEQLKAQGHRLQLGQGIVGSVANSGQAFLAEDVAEVPDFVRNPLLPMTQAELAVPVRKGDVILGVLDMQSEEVGGFSQADLTLMQSIADQVAVAVDNARLFREARAAAAESEALTRRLTRETWQDIGSRVSTSGYVFNKSEVVPITKTATADEAWLPIMAEAIQQKDLAYHASSASSDEAQDGQPSCVSIPLMLRNEVIGVIGIERAPHAPAGEVGLEPQEAVDQVQAQPWTDDELTAIRTVAEQVALALDTARLARETERAAWRDRVVSESTARVWATSEIEEVMKAAVSQLGDRLRASEVVIRLGKEDELLPE